MNIAADDIPDTVPGAWIRSLTGLVLRLGLGAQLLTSGVGKLQARPAGEGLAPWVEPLSRTLLGRQLPGLLEPLGRIMPYVEVALGGLLIVGLLTGVAAIVAAVVLLLPGVLTAQVVPADEHLRTALHQILLAAAILWLSRPRDNRLSLDALLAAIFGRRDRSSDTMARVIRDSLSQASR